MISKSSKETEELGYKFAQTLKKGDVVSLRGSLGAGKTVFTKGIARALDVKENIVSPTFTLIQEYDGIVKLYHLDIYRLSGIDEFESMGGDDYLPSDGVSVIEWSEKISSLLPDDTIYVEIKILENNDREIKIRRKGNEYTIS